MAAHSGSAAVQDDSRSKMIGRHLGLLMSRRRMGIDAHDEDGNPFEVKSGTTGRWISTARDTGLHTVARWRRQFWAIGSGEQQDDGQFLLTELWACHPSHLEAFFEKVESLVRRGLRAGEAVVAVAEASGLCDPEDLRLARAAVERGVKLNDPRIEMAMVRQHCSRLSHRDAEEARTQLRQFVRVHPLDRSVTAEAPATEEDVFGSPPEQTSQSTQV